jgi:hypothetical protein
MKGWNRLELQSVKATELTSKRGRPRKDYSGYLGFESPLGLRIEAILDEGKKAGEGPHVDALCLRCGERSTPRLRDVLRGHSQSGGCRKKECYLAYCDRAVARLDQTDVAGVWSSRYAGLSRKATAAKFKLAYPIADAAQRAYQAKVDAMMADGTAGKIYELASQPHWDIRSAAAHLNLTFEVALYLTLALKKGRRVTQEAAIQVPKIVAKPIVAPVGIEAGVVHSEIWWCAFIATTLVEYVKNRKDRTIAPPGELASGELKRTKGELRGATAEIYEQCVELLEDVAVPGKFRADMREFVDIANLTLARRRDRQERAADTAVRQKQLKANLQQQRKPRG